MPLYIDTYFKTNYFPTCFSFLYYCSAYFFSITGTEKYLLVKDAINLSAFIVCYVTNRLR